MCGRVSVWFLSFYFFPWPPGFFLSLFLSPTWANLGLLPTHPCRKVPAPSACSMHPRPELGPTDWVGAFSASGAWELGKGLLRNNKRGKKVRSLAVSTYSDAPRLQSFADVDSLVLSPCRPGPRPRPAESRGPPSLQAATTPRGLVLWKPRPEAAEIRQPPSRSPLRGQNSFASVDLSWDCILKQLQLFLQLFFQK